MSDLQMPTVEIEFHDTRIGAMFQEEVGYELA